MLLETMSLPWQKARATNYSTNGYPTKVHTATKPSGDGVIEMTRDSSGGVVQNSLVVMFYGTGSDNNTGSCRALAWSQVGNDPNTSLWVYFILAEFAFTLSASVGVAGKQVVATERFADTVTLTYGNDDVSLDIVSPANDIPTRVVFDCFGAQFVELIFTTGGSATDLNALYRKL